jgi:uncharacterized protein (DUF1800 family)
MERRSFLSKVGKSSDISVIAAPPPPEPSSNLKAYSGVWNTNAVTHLLRRTTFGFKFADIDTFVKLGLNASIDKLFTSSAIAEFPLNMNYADDPEVPIGTTWVNAKYGLANNVTNYRLASLRSWKAEQTLKGELDIREKLVTFWINHFAVSEILDARYSWKYINNFYNHYAGDFKKLVEEITIDPSMLIFLNGNTNTKRAPNENYAREVLELFTIGKGADAGPGDYTNYTEKDVLELAKVFTGWSVYGYTNATVVGMGSRFTLANHETATKQLSARFNNAKIDNKGENEYKEAINIIFQQPEVARFITRKLYRFFVHYKITPDVEANIIEPLAKIIRNDNYVIKNALITLFKSEHFYDINMRGVMIKNPQDFVAQAIVGTEVGLPTDAMQKYTFCLNADVVHGVLQMQTFDPPDVAGWKAYYQTPTFYRGWVNSVTLPMRYLFTDAIHSRGKNYRGLNRQADWLKLANTLPNSQNINDFISNLNTLMFVRPFNTKQLSILKTVLNPNKTDKDWETEVNNWKATPTNTTMATNLGNKIATLMRYLTNLPEYQLS